MAYKLSASRKRKAALNRRADGTFGPWKGGYTKAQLKKKRTPFQGIAVHIGKEFVKQHKRRAKVGELVRTKKSDGSYHKQAFWYVKTVHGWRPARTGAKKPNWAQVHDVLKTSRKGR